MAKRALDSRSSRGRRTPRARGGVMPGTRGAAHAGSPSARTAAQASDELRRVNRELNTQIRGLREHQRNLEHARAQYTDLFDFAPVTYTLLDGVGMVLAINLAGSRLLTLERARVVGHPLLGFVLQADRRGFLEHLRQCRSGTGIVESELRFATDGEGHVTCRLYSKRAHQDGQAVFPTVIVDQTERLALDEARLAAERQRDEARRAAEVAEAANAAKGRFLNTVSHELRTPLTPALFAASRLAEWDGLSDDARQLAVTIQRNIEYEARLIDDLLDVARISRNRISLRLETLDVHEVVGEALRICEPIASGKNVTLTPHLVASTHHVRADRARLRQVFWNLLINAIKFTDDGGQVIVRSGNAEDASIRISIRDTGAGMGPDQLQKLFAPFDRVSPPMDSRSGLGLGLALCKGIVSAHGGQISAASQGPGSGSTFEVELATAPPPAPVETQAPRSAEKDTPAGRAERTVRVLLIEDDPDSREMLAMFLSHYGYGVEAVSSLTAGVTRLGEPWDIILSDIGLPDGSGLEVARRAQRLSRRPRRLIALTGYGSSDDIQASRQAGFDDHVVKPVDLENLLRTLHVALAKPG